MKDIEETNKKTKNVIAILRGEAISHTHNWKDYPNKKSLKDVDKEIDQLWSDFKEIETDWKKINEDYSRLLANQKPNNLPEDWEQQIASKKDLEIKLNAAQTDLSNEQQARQQAESKIKQAEQFGLTDWNNLTNQIGSETLASLLERPQKSELEEIKRERDSRPNITAEEYNRLQNNQKSSDYDSVKSELDEWKKKLGSQDLEQVQKKISELEKRPTPDQLGNLIEENTQLQKQITSLQNFVDKLPGLVNEEGEVNEELLALLNDTLAAVEKLGQLAERKKRLESNNQVGEGEEGRIIKKTIPTGGDVGNNDEETEAEKQIQTELEKVDNIKIEEIGDEELTALLVKFKEMKDWIFNGNEKQKGAAKSKSSELKKVTDKLKLEDGKRWWEKEITNGLKDKKNEGNPWHLELKSSDLGEPRFISFKNTLKGMTGKRELDEFGSKIKELIGRCREIRRDLNEVLRKGKEIVENKDAKSAEEFLNYWETYKRLAEQNKEKKYLLHYGKIIEVTMLIDEIESLVKNAQVIQPSK